MSGTASAREALIAEAIGDVARLLREVEALAPALDEGTQALRQASASLRDEMAGFEARIAALTEQARTQTARHLAARTEEAARRVIEQQTRAMADAARVAFGTELGAMVQRLQGSTPRAGIRDAVRWWWTLSHGAVAGTAATGAWLLARQGVCG